MPPIDLNTKLTPWWVRQTLRTVEITLKGDTLANISDKDFEQFQDAVEKLNYIVRQDERYTF